MLNGVKSTGRSCGQSLNGSVGRRSQKPRKDVRSGDRTLRQGDSLSQIWIFDLMPVHRDSELAAMAEHFFGYGRWDAPFWFIGSEAGMDKGGKDSRSVP